jgi:hypothetical protein
MGSGSVRIRSDDSIRSPCDCCYSFCHAAFLLLGLASHCNFCVLIIRGGACGPAVGSQSCNAKVPIMQGLN